MCVLQEGFEDASENGTHGFGLLAVVAHQYGHGCSEHDKVATWHVHHPSFINHHPVHCGQSLWQQLKQHVLGR
jgi:hypothetical protein